MALAKAQLKTQTPSQPATPIPMPPKNQRENSGKNSLSPDANHNLSEEGAKNPAKPENPSEKDSVQPVQYSAPVDADVTANKTIAIETGLPPDWPDARGFIPPGPRNAPPPLVTSDAPVLRHTKTYNGHDMEFTSALSSYFYFRDDARFGGWQSYLNRSDDFIRFCCHMHISEMLSARGGAGESRVVWRWLNIR
jgi:hypothetical protein